MKDKILLWMATGSVGCSSKAMACAAAELPSDGSHPYDPDDLNRCLLLLDAVPEIRVNMDKVAAMSEKWRLLISRWDEVEKCFLDEVGLGWTKSDRAPKTYKLMKTVFGEL